MTDNGQPLVYLSVSDAAKAYDVSPRTLLHQLREAHVPGHKERGPRGHEWRVSTAALEAFGYQPGGAEEPTDVIEVQRTIQRMRDLLIHERRRADQLDGRLGQVTMELARSTAELQRIQASRRVVDLDDRRRPNIPAPRQGRGLSAPEPTAQQQRGR